MDQDENVQWPAETRGGKVTGGHDPSSHLTALWSVLPPPQQLVTTGQATFGPPKTQQAGNQCTKHVGNKLIYL